MHGRVFLPGQTAPAIFSSGNVFLRPLLPHAENELFYSVYRAVQEAR
jgi:hypothetical protein